MKHQQPVSLTHSDQRERYSLLISYNPELAEFVSQYLTFGEQPIEVVATSTKLNIEVLSPRTENIINLRRVNDVRYVNKFFESVNDKLDEGGRYIGCLEDLFQRKKRIRSKFPLFLVWFALFIDFLWKRLIPKLPLTKKVYFALTKGHNRVLTLSEVLGRLVSCGFEIEDYEQIENQYYFVAKKVTEPTYDMHPSYGPLVGLNRVGENGKKIKVRKFRTMHPYSEYLQEFIYHHNDLQEGGKFSNDFRITGWGRIMRKYWLDELPMLWNWLKGDMKLVGVRPISNHYFELYPDEFQQRRIQYKPGLIPPFYKDMPKTLEEIVESERRYLNQYDQAPIRTDIHYLFSSLYNILIRKERSN
ncbi:MAG: sugar transferase [Bacteroidota bacterium]